MTSGPCAGASPDAIGRRIRTRNLFEAVAKPFDGLTGPFSSLRPQGWRRRVWAAVALLAATCLMASAEDTNGPSGTNDLSQTSSPTQTNSSMEAGALTPASSLALTNNPAETNASVQAVSPTQTNALIQPAGPIQAGVPVPVASAAPTNSRTRLDYSAFSIIAERNIFNPNRYYVRPGEGPRPTPKVTEFLALTGTISYEKGTFAVFDGTRSEYQKVVKPSDAIAGYTVMDIEPNCVKLTSGTNHVKLDVGTQMRRDDEGDWTLAGLAESYASASISASASVSSSVSSSAATVPSAAPPTASSGEESDVVKRMMQRREKE